MSSSLEYAIEELNALLTLAEDNSEGEYDYSKNSLVKLFKAWERRTPEPIARQALQSISANKWKKMEYPLSLWAFSIKMKYPSDVSAPIQSVWPDDMSAGAEVSDLIIKRLEVAIDQGAKSLSTLISVLEDDGSFFSAATKKPELLKQIRPVLEKILSHASPQIRQVFHLFPLKLRDEVKNIAGVNEKELSVEKTIINLLGKTNSPAKFVSDIIPLIERLPAKNHEKGGALIDALRSYINCKDLPYKTFAILQDKLIDAGWSEKQIFQMVPNIYIEGLKKDDEGFLALKISHNRSHVLDDLESTLDSLPHSPVSVKQLEQATKMLALVHRNGLDKKTLDAHFNKKKDLFSIPHVLEGVLKKPNKIKWQLLVASPAFEKFAALAPSRLTGSLLLLGELAGAKIDRAIPDPYPLLSTNELDLDDCIDEAGNKRSGQELFDLQQQYKTRSLAISLSNSVSGHGVSPASKRVRRM